ncbi:GL18091 [Drosophila persimilis]|uniref:GL18091 n=1 Tax=Drosophila persimilis TaxID=7234 RepID=B4HC36_DROPE|nr:GL18091 [Drosophila persimilis]
MCKLPHYSVIILLCLQSQLVAGERSVEFLAGNCSYNPKYFKNFSLTISRNMMNMDMGPQQAHPEGLQGAHRHPAAAGECQELPVRSSASERRLCRHLRP